MGGIEPWGPGFDPRCLDPETVEQYRKLVEILRADRRALMAVLHALARREGGTLELRYVEMLAVSPGALLSVYDDKARMRWVIRSNE